jgi:hypothetical protein
MLPLSAFQSGGMAAALQMNDVRGRWPRDRRSSCPGNGAEREHENEVKIHLPADSNA